MIKGLKDFYFIFTFWKMFVLVYQLMINQIIMVNYFYRHIYYKKLQLKESK